MKKAVYGLLFATGIGIGYGLYLFNQKPPDTRTEKAAFEILAGDLVKQFSDDEAGATRKFADQVLIVSGKVVEIKSSGKEASVMLSSGDPMAGVTCSFYSDETSQLKGVVPGMRIRIKGKCTGKLIDVVLNNCSLVKQEIKIN